MFEPTIDMHLAQTCTLIASKAGYPQVFVGGYPSRHSPAPPLHSMEPDWQTPERLSFRVGSVLCTENPNGDCSERVASPPEDSPSHMNGVVLFSLLTVLINSKTKPHPWS